MITVERTDFMKALQLVSPIVKAASDIVALKAARITANGEFVVDANDLDRSMRCRLPYQGQPAAFMLPTPAKVASAMRYAAAKQVTLTKDDDAGVAIKAGDLAAELAQSIAPEDHPGVDLVADEEWSVDVGAGELAQLARLLGAISTEETRYYLNGVMLSHVGDWTWRGHATDGHRLYIIDIPLPGVTGELPDGIIIPRQFLKGMLADFARTKNPVRLSYGMKPLPNEVRPDVTLPVGPRGRVFQVSGMLGNVHCAVSTKLIDGNYPDVMRVVPTEVASTVTVGKAALVQALRALTAMSSEKTRAVSFDVEEEALRIALKSPEVGVSSYRIPARTTGLHPTTACIGFNANYLFDLCAALKGEEIVFGLSGNGLPVTITDPADTTFKAVLMPVRI